MLCVVFLAPLLDKSSEPKGERERKKEEGRMGIKEGGEEWWKLGEGEVKRNWEIRTGERGRCGM